MNQCSSLAHIHIHAGPYLLGSRISIIQHFLIALEENSSQLPFYLHRWSSKLVAALSRVTYPDQDRNIGPSASQLAWQNHVAKLTEKEREMFLNGNIGEIDNYVAALDAASKRQRKDSRAVKISEKLKPLIDALNMYAPIAHTMSQADPSPSAFVLGGISCVLSILPRFLEYQASIIEMLSNMADGMALLSRYEKEIYENDAQIQKCLIDLYGDVLDFCREASKLLYEENGKPRGPF